MGLLAGAASVAQIQPLYGLIATRNFGELALISYAVGPSLLPRDMG